jgi:hypothetical protein
VLDKRRWHAVVMAIAATSGACGKTDAKPDVQEIPTAAPPYGVAPEPTMDPPEAGPVPTVMPPRPAYGIPRNDRLPDAGKRRPKNPPDDF